MRVVIVDDEPIARQNVRELLNEAPGVEVVGEAGNGVEAVAVILRLHPDLAILDLQMPELDGFGVVKALQGERAPLVIYVTAFADHALRAFDAGALDYLLKPVRAARMEAALEKARTQLEGMKRERQDKDSRPVERIVGRSRQGLHLFQPSEVVAFSADGDLVYVHTHSGRYYAEQTLKQLEARLPPPFVRVHRGTIINADHIRKVSPLSSKRWLLTMSNGFEAVVSKRMKGALRGVAGQDRD